MAPKKTTVTNKKNNDNADNYIWSVGRRKRAIARIRLYPKPKKEDAIDIQVNGKPVGQYFHNPVAKMTYAQPLQLTDTVSKYRVTVRVEGSGLESQLDAVKHGMAKALVKADSAYKPILRQNGLMTRDDRVKQKRMIGQGGKARAKKQSPKR